MRHRVQIFKIAILIFSIVTSSSIYIISFRLRQQTIINYKKKQWEVLNYELTDLIKKFPGRAGIAIVDLHQGWSIFYNGALKFPAASIIKLPVGVVVYKAITAGKIPRKQVVNITRFDMVGGSGIIRKRSFPQKYTLEKLTALMLSISDNTACNVIIKLLGFDYINTEMRKLGLRDTLLQRFMMDFRARRRGSENYTSPRDIARVWELLYQGKLLGEKFSFYLIDTLKNQKVKDRIPRLLPPGISVANKTGLEKNVCHDSGIIFTPYGDILVVVLTSDFKNYSTAKTFIARVAFLSYRYILHSHYEESSACNIIHTFSG